MPAMRYGASMDVFADKTVFIAGAATDLTWRLLPQLERAEARVILLDDDADELMSMARRNPSVIEPLPINRLSARTCAVVGEIWEAEPVDVFLDLVALTSTDSGEQKLAVSRALLKSFEPALMAADGCVISVVPKTTRNDRIEHQVAEAGYLQLAETLANRWAKWRVTYNVLRPVAGASASSMAKAVDIAARAGWDNFTGVHIPISSAAH